MKRRICLIAMCAALVLSMSARVHAAQPKQNMQQRYQALMLRMQRMEAKVKELEKEKEELKEANLRLQAENKALKIDLAKANLLAVQSVPQISPTPLLTDSEYQTILTLVAARNADLLAKGLSERSLMHCRHPLTLQREYERYKYDEAKRRWKERPVIPNMDDPCYTWHADGKNYQRQLFCSKCKGKVAPGPGSKPCDGWVNPNGFSCQMLHGMSNHDCWMFLCNYLKDRSKGIEAKAALWDAKEHGDITEEFWTQIMNEAWATK